MSKNNKAWYTTEIPKIDGFTVVIPSDIRSTHKFLVELGRLLNFPDYYGENWNALEECIRDLNWISKTTIVLIHKKLPAISIDQLRIYIDILKCAVESWEKWEEHDLVVVLPANVEIPELTVGMPGYTWDEGNREE